MAIDEAAIDHLAQLARLRIDPDDLPEVATRIGRVLDLVDQLQAAATDGVAPMAHPLDATQRLRADEVTEADRREAFQAIAPSVQDGLYLVPKVID